MPDSLWTLAFWFAGFCGHMLVIGFIGYRAGILMFAPKPEGK